MSDDGPGTPSLICDNEVDTRTLLQSGHNTERNASGAIAILVCLGSNDRRGNNDFQSSLDVVVILNSLKTRTHSKHRSKISNGE